LEIFGAVASRLGKGIAKGVPGGQLEASRRRPASAAREEQQVKTYGIVLVAAIITLSSCSTSTSVKEDEMALPSGTWALTRIEPHDGVAISVSDPSRYTVEFHDDNSVHIRADCNLCNGGYENKGTHIELGLLACTLAACPPQSLADSFLDALSSATTHELSKGELLVAYPDGVLRFSLQ
jgi:heat shock protein HslJ